MPTWRRLSIAEFFVIDCAVALGCSLTLAYRQPFPGPSIPSGKMLLAGVITLQLAGPMIMSVQFSLRSRRCFLSLQELLWVTPLISYVVTLVASHILVVSLGIEAVWLAAILFLTILASGAVAVGLLLTRLCLPESLPSWYWGDYVGCLACISAAFYALWEVTTGMWMRDL